MNINLIKKLLVISIITILVAWILYPFLYAFLFAGLFAIMLAPLQQKLEKYLSKEKSSFLIVITILLCVFIPLIILFSYAVTEAIILVKNPKPLIHTFNSLEAHVVKIPYIGEFIQQNMKKLVTIITQDQAKITTLLTNLLPTVKYIGSASISFVLDFFITLLLIYQFLVSGSILKKFFKKVVLTDFENKDTFIETSISTTRNVSLAVFISATLVAFIMGTIYFFIDLPTPILFATITAVAAMIPFFVGIVYILLAIGVFFLMSTTKAIIILAIGFGLNIITDNIIQPKIINKEAHLSFVASLLGIMGGIEAFGFIGVFLGPVIFNVVFVGLQKSMAEN